MSKINIRKSTKDEIPRLLEIFAMARKFMAETGNPHQWGSDYPDEALLLEDIMSGDSYVCIHDGRIVGTFVLRGGDDPTYEVIHDGAWLNDLPYGTIHRIAGSGEMKGILHSAMELAQQQHQTIRIDTHRDNKVMQNALKKEGFTYCGIIHCWNGSERLAYQYARSPFEFCEIPKNPPQDPSPSPLSFPSAASAPEGPHI